MRKSQQANGNVFRVKSEPRTLRLKSPRSIYDVIIVGAGVVGCALARRISQSGLAVAVVERASDVGEGGASKANSAISHCGFDAEPNSLEAALVIGASRRWPDLARHLKIPFRSTGALMVAKTEDEMVSVRKYYKRSLENGIDDVELLNGYQARSMEPHVFEGQELIGALHIPREDVTDPFATCEAYAETALTQGNTDFFFECEIDHVGPSVTSSSYTFNSEFYNRLTTDRKDLRNSASPTPSPKYVPTVHSSNVNNEHIPKKEELGSPKVTAESSVRPSTNHGKKENILVVRSSKSGVELLGRNVINSCGLGAQSLFETYSSQRKFTLNPRRGQFLVFDSMSRTLLSKVLLPVPGPLGKGILITPTIFGNLLAGPTAEDLPMNQLDEATQTTREGLDQVRASVFGSLPGLKRFKPVAQYAGARSNCQEGNYILDYGAAHPGIVTLAGIRSTGLSASFAIADEVFEQMEARGMIKAPHSFRCEGRDRYPPWFERQQLIGTSSFAHSDSFANSARDSECSSHTASPIASPPSAAIHDPSSSSQGESLNAFAETNDQTVSRSLADAFTRTICYCEHVDRSDIERALQGPLTASTTDAIKRRTRATAGRCQGFNCLVELCRIIATKRRLPVRSVSKRGPGTEWFPNFHPPMAKDSDLHTNILRHALSNDGLHSSQPQSLLNDASSKQISDDHQESSKHSTNSPAKKKPFTTRRDEHESDTTVNAFRGRSTRTELFVRTQQYNLPEVQWSAWPLDESFDVVVIGGGPAGLGIVSGLASSTKLDKILLVERADRLGGIPERYRNSSKRTYFDPESFSFVSGGDIAARLRNDIFSSPFGHKINIKHNSTVTSIVALDDRGKRNVRFRLITQSGHSFLARSIVVATGAREATAVEREIVTGHRASGVVYSNQILMLNGGSDMLPRGKILSIGKGLVARSILEPSGGNIEYAPGGNVGRDESPWVAKWYFGGSDISSERGDLQREVRVWGPHGFVEYVNDHSKAPEFKAVVLGGCLIPNDEVFVNSFHSHNQAVTGVHLAGNVKPSSAGPWPGMGCYLHARHVLSRQVLADFI